MRNRTPLWPKWFDCPCLTTMAVICLTAIFISALMVIITIMGLTGNW